MKYRYKYLSFRDLNHKDIESVINQLCTFEGSRIVDIDIAPRESFILVEYLVGSDADNKEIAGRRKVFNEFSI